MVLLNLGINEIRDAIDAILSTAQLGSSGTAVTEGDTALGTAIAGTSKSVTTTTFFKGIKISFATDAGDGSGYSAREFVVTTTGAVALLRATFPNIDINSITQVDVDTQLLLIQQF